MSATKQQADAVRAIKAVDGWCEKLPSANCMHCPIVCYVDDSNEDIARKANEWIRDNAQ